MNRSIKPLVAAIVGGFLVICLCCAGALAAGGTTVDAPKIERCQIGFGDQFKVGYWTPIWVDISSVPGEGQLSIEVTTNDSDGVATTVSGPPAGSSDSTPLYVKVGRIGNPIHIALLSDGKVLDYIDLESGLRSESAHVGSQPATSELIVQLGAASAGLSEAFPDHDPAEGGLGRRLVHVDDVDRLPTDWYGYEGVDLLVLTTSDIAMCQKLVADAQRFAALKEWVEQGGRLVVTCGRNAPKLIGDSAPLGNLVPGKFAELIRLPQTRGLENFAESNTQIGKPGAQLAIAMPRLTDVSGQVEVFGRGSELPLVVRSARGFGEIMFVGLDLDQRPLSDWAGREAFWRAALKPCLSSNDGEGAPQRLTSLGYSDLSGALRQRLGRAFATVTTISFSIVAGLILAYLLLLGPLDYLLVHRLIGRPMVAWISFPLLVLATCCGAAALAHRSKGTQPHVNQTELVDFDASTGRARGSYWSTLYSPQSDRYDLRLATRLPGGHTAETPETLLSWFGLAGSGLGGMNGGGTMLDIARTGYQLVPRLDGLEGVPILTGSTKAISARWTASAAAPCSADLKVDEDGLMIGNLKNNSDATLADACLLYGQWGYRLGDLGPGKQIEVGPALNPIHVTTLLARRVRPSTAAEGDAAMQKTFSPEQATDSELLETMMFYDVLGGQGFAGLPNRYQDFCDLSGLLDLGRAIVVAKGDRPGSQLIDKNSGQPLAASDDSSAVVYRVIFPVSTESRVPKPQP